MSARRRPHPSLVAIIALLPLLAGCGGLLPAPPKRQLYRLAPSLSFSAGLPHSAAQILVAAPTAPAGLDSRRIALSRTPVSLDYYADGEWTDRAPFLIQDALVDGFEKSGTVPAVAADRGGLSADYILDTEVDDFAANYDSPNGPPTARVALTAKLIRMADRKIIAHTAIRREQRAAANTLPDIVHAFDAAVGGAAEEVVVWTVSNPTLSAPRRSAR